MDNHTSDFQEFSDVNPGEVLLIKKLLVDSHLNVPMHTAQAIGKVNINSMNFRIGKHYLKIIQSNPGTDIVLRTPELYAIMKKAGIPTASFVADVRGNSISCFPNSRNPDYYFYLQHFIDGNFYTGSEQEFKVILEVLKKQRGLFSSVDISQWPKKPYTTWKPHEAFERAINVSNENSDFDRLVRPELGKLLHLADEFVKERQRFNFSTLHHLDLHPHNLLFKKSVLKSVLDIESVSVVPYEIATGFNLFKLARKAISTKRMTLDHIRTISSEKFDMQNLRQCAKYELLRRLSIILELHYFRKNFEWDQDLRKHLMGLYEVDLIFS